MYPGYIRAFSANHEPPPEWGRDGAEDILIDTFATPIGSLGLGVIAPVVVLKDARRVFNFIFNVPFWATYTWSIMCTVNGSTDGTNWTTFGNFTVSYTSPLGGSNIVSGYGFSMLQLICTPGAYNMPQKFTASMLISGA